MSKEVLPLANHAQVFVVQYQDLYWESMDAGSCQLAERHLKSTISDDCYDRIVGTPKLCANGCGKSEAHSAGAARRKPLAVVSRLVKLSGPHLVLSYVGRNDGASRC